ncbi:MAG: hypothetical protein MUF50_05085, partial [Planctomycetes bacterium]|nr:hypothetical protein [Planctomycetota bacterium]
MKRKLFIILIIFIWGSTLVFSPFLVKISQADDSDIDVLNLQIKEQRKQLETLQKKQKQYLDSIKRISQEKDSLKTQIELLGERVGKTELEIEEVKLQINETNLEISKITIEIQQTNERIEKEKGHIASLLRLVYKQDQSSTLEILMLNDSLNDFLNQAKYLENTNKEIAKSLESLKNDKVKMEDNKKQLDDKNL